MRRCWRETSRSCSAPMSSSLLIEGDAVSGVVRDSSRLTRPIDRRAQRRGAGDRRLLARCKPSQTLLPRRRRLRFRHATAGTGDGLAARDRSRRRAQYGMRPARPIGCRRRCSARADGSRGVFPHTVTDRAKPGVIAVNAAGRRFVNEALSYHEFVLAMLRDGNDAADRPFYLVCDRHFLWSYGLGRIKPFTRACTALCRKRRIDRGARASKRSRRRSASKTSALSATLAELQFAMRRMGRDPEFGRGSTDLSAAPRRYRPQAQSLRRADRARAVLRDADLSGRSRHRDRYEGGRPGAGAARGRHAIAGLYACGNDMGSIMNGNYPGPGITLGPALTFGYIAGRHLAERSVAAMPIAAKASV